MLKIILTVALLMPGLCVAQNESSKPPSLSIGKKVFLNSCINCHGETGMGDGKLAAIIRNPPPFNLTESNVSDAYLRQIISKGGAAMGRSDRMPTWGKELNTFQIESVAMYVKTLRKNVQTSRKR